MLKKRHESKGSEPAARQTSAREEKHSGNEASSQPPRRRRWWRVLLFLFLAYAVTFSLVLGFGLAYVLNVMQSVDPQLASMETYRPKQVTRILDHDGREVGVIYVERRELVTYSDLPRELVEALVATEDKNFFSHPGVDPMGILRAAWVNYQSGTVRQGGSTITVQLAKDLFTTGAKTYERKIKEAFLALRITQRYTKEETLEIYLNQVTFGHNTHGIQSAAQFYFDKDVSELTLPECAMLIGLLKAPTDYSPRLHPKKAQTRMRVVLQRMVDEGYLTQREMESARDTTVRLAGNRRTVQLIPGLPYWWDYIRAHLAAPDMFGTAGSPGERSEKSGVTYDDLREQGFLVRTTVDSELQEYCQDALLEHIKNVEQERRRYNWHWGDDEPRPWPTRLSDGAVLDAVIRATDEARISVQLSHIGGNPTVSVAYDPQGTWLDDYGVLRRGDHVRVVAHKDGDEWRYTLYDEPHVQGAVVVLEVGTGRILAMAGGTDYYESNFNRAWQGRRQPGSAFKPVVYTAALEERETWRQRAVEAEMQGLPSPRLSGVTITSPLNDSEKIYHFGNKTWIPGNYHGAYHGRVTVQYALEQSLNVATIDLAETMARNTREGLSLTANVARRLGIESPIGDNLSVVLGTSELTPLELASAYATLANGGLYNKPWSVESIRRLDDLLVFHHEAEPHQGVSPEVAFLTTRLLENVIQNGTGRRARELGRYLAGKTGTTNEYTDAWFAGYSSGICTVVYLGFDRKKSLGRGMQGSHAALPLWIDVMKKTRDLYPADFREWEIPDGLVHLSVCTSSGRLPVTECHATHTVIDEYYLRGTEPYEYCNVHTFVTMEPRRRPSLVSLLQAPPEAPAAEGTRRVREQRPGASVVAPVERPMDRHYFEWLAPGEIRLDDQENFSFDVR